MEIWHYAFFWKALAAGVALGVSAGPAGVFLILRRDSLLPHALTHVAFVGVALGFLLRGAPLALALAVTVAAAFAVMEIRERAGIYEDTAVGILAGLGLALAVVLASLARSYDVRLLTYLFGNILVVTREETLLALGLLVVTLAVLHRFRESLLFVSFDEESARAAGLSVKTLKLLLATLTALLVVIGMRMVGLLLVSALMVIPGAAALEVARSFRQCLWLSGLFGGISVAGGLAVSVTLDLPPSGAIVLFSGLLFLLCLFARRVK